MKGLKISVIHQYLYYFEKQEFNLVMYIFPSSLMGAIMYESVFSLLRSEEEENNWEKSYFSLEYQFSFCVLVFPER